MAVSRNKYAIGICFVIIGTAAIGAALGTLYRPMSLVQRTVATVPEPLRPRADCFEAGAGDSQGPANQQ